MLYFNQPFQIHTENTPNLILRDLYTPGTHCVLKPPALTFKESGLSTKMPLPCTVTSGQQDPNHKMTAVTNRLRFLYTIFFFLYMPWIVVGSASPLVLGTTLVAHWPTTLQNCPVFRPWHGVNSNECLSGLVLERLSKYYYGKMCLLYCRVLWKKGHYYIFCFNDCCYYECKCKSIFTFNTPYASKT